MKYLLSIDGGGVRAIIAISFLNALNEFLKKKNKKTVYDTFDMYAGTSSGAMVISSISYHNYDISFICDTIFSKDNVNKIFTKYTCFPYSLYNFIRPKYIGAGKECVIHKYSEDFIIEGSDKDCLITGYDINHSKPVFFKSYENNGYEKVPLSTAINISSAAPSYFPAIKYNNVYYMDGGVFAMNPADCLYADALKLYPNETFKILSIGYSSYTFPEKDGVELWGPLQWLLQGSIIDRLTYTDVPTVDYRMSLFSKDYLRIEANTDALLDDVSRYDELMELGGKLFEKNREALDKFFTESIEEEEKGSIEEGTPSSSSEGDDV